MRIIHSHYDYIQNMTLDIIMPMVIEVYQHANQKWGQFNSGIGIDYLKNGIGIEIFKFELELRHF